MLEITMQAMVKVTMHVTCTVGIHGILVKYQCLFAVIFLLLLKT